MEETTLRLKELLFPSIADVELPEVLADEVQGAMCRTSSRDFCCSSAVHSFAWGSEAVLR